MTGPAHAALHRAMAGLLPAWRQANRLPPSFWQRRMPMTTMSAAPHIRYFASRSKLSSKQQSTRPVAAGAVAAPPEIDPNAHRVIETELIAETSESYLAYAMSVIVGRALPDVRDGLKPVHRRILFAMHDLGMTSGKPHRKCARVVGEVLGKYHPHGDSAVYNALVRLAQDFSMNAPLISGHGNFGSIDNDPAAAMRYTECRLDALSSAMLLADLDTHVIQYTPNFDESQEEPSVLPARLPNLLVNGSSGIAVGIATNIPPHNLQEVVNGLCALIRNPAITVRQLMQHIPAPDFPTGAQIVDSPGISSSYHDGRGSITMRGTVTIEEPSTGKGKSKGAGSSPLIVITELPYQTNKADLVVSIAELVDKSVITGVSDVRDESDRTGMRIVIEPKRGSSPEVILNNLYKHTSLQGRFSCNMVALVDGRPQSLDLKAFLSHFLDFRCDIIRKRADRDLLKAKTRLHLVEGFLLAMRDLDKVVEVIRGADDGSAAAEALQSVFGLSPEQTEGVLNLSLRRLTSLETQKLEAESATLNSSIADLTDLLQKKERVLEVVETEAQELARRFGRPRRSLICSEAEAEIQEDESSVIPNEPCFVVFSKRGFVKRLKSDTFATQKKGGRGTKGTTLRGDDSMSEVLHVMAHDSILFLTQDGIARSIKAYQIPEASRTAAGSAITQVLPISKADTVATMLPVSKFVDDQYITMLTQRGLVKKTPISEFANIRSNGLRAITLVEGDVLKAAARCKNGDSLLLAASNGMAMRFELDNLQTLSRTARGVKSMDVSDDAHLVGMAVLPEAVHPDADGPWLLLTTAKGLGKRLEISTLPIRQTRTGKGVIVIKLNEAKGDRLVDISLVGRESGNITEEVMFVSRGGLMCRSLLSSISITGRLARGSSVLNLQDGDEMLAVTPIKTILAPESVKNSK
eukprot:CAMPEP_0206139348 /NCGR_PEP_ID=MMETSP1473-20131121/5552_1 /ASSEMBLY_ACC=CAM_ASM_001109 /TAXON_ID=1461547 /ORGANISM="Stichococcus sp, Strain RCC1054" /LENGTH=919 /DNA_ID=CAMNT_0053533103 /DNA_START=196 /DNA_END=2955 /DNA_ORIENTATION=-